MTTKQIIEKIRYISLGMTNREIAKKTWQSDTLIGKLWTRKWVSIERLQDILNGLGYEMKISIRPIGCNSEPDYYRQINDLVEAEVAKKDKPFTKQEVKEMIAEARIKVKEEKALK